MSVRVELRRDAGNVGPACGPWVRRKQISRIHGHPDPHGLAAVVDRKGETIGHGLISPVSGITVRLLSFGAEPPPETWLTDRLHGAFAARDDYRFQEEGTTGYRVVNTEGDGLPGLVIDRFGSDLVMQVTTAPMAAREEQILAWLRMRWDGAIHVVMPQASGALEGFTANSRPGHDNDHMLYHEHGLSLAVSCPPTQKTGAYFDQRQNHWLVAQLAKRHGGRLLDMGCYVGSFALCARKLGVEAVGVDQSAQALEHARKNVERNHLPPVTWIQSDMFFPIDRREMEGTFGTIVFDPPKIASNKTDVSKASQALVRGLSHLAPKLEPGGHLVLCSCSHHMKRDALDKVVCELGARTGQRYARVLNLGAGVDHPIFPGHIEGEYLRVNVYQRRT